MHGSRRCYGELEELTVDDFWQIADAGDQELWKLAHSSRRGTLELGAKTVMDWAGQDIYWTIGLLD